MENAMWTMLTWLAGGGLGIRVGDAVQLPKTRRERPAVCACCQRTDGFALHHEGCELVAVLKDARDNPPLKLWLVRPSDPDWSGYDTFAATIVAAWTEDEARMVHPLPTHLGVAWSVEFHDGLWVDEDGDRETSTWPVDPKDLTVTLLGVAADGVEPGTALSSYRAG